MQFNAIIIFWFKEIDSRLWWKKDKDFDHLIRERYSAIHMAATRGELVHWRDAAEGRLAEIIVLDQFSRNMFRGEPQSFASDPQALVLAQEAVSQGKDKEVPPEKRQFFYLPFMHSESLQIHDQALELFDQKGLESNYQFELKHRAILDRFGRYPHRNLILGRSSSDEEKAFLEQPGSSF